MAADGQAYVKAQAGRRGMTVPSQDREKEAEAFKHPRRGEPERRG